MDFYKLFRSIRNNYQNEANKEIELQILTQLQSMYFFNNDQMPTKVIFQLDVKSLLKNAQLSKDDQDDWNEYKKYCSDIKKRTKVFLL